MGRYHHWDGYPSSLGVTLIDAYNITFAGSRPEGFAAMIQTLIFDHPAGWSTINNADWSFEPGFVDTFGLDRATTCCGEVHWKHYRQYYSSHPEVELPPGSDIAVFGHTAETEVYPEDSRPQCYCHGGRSEPQNTVLNCINNGGTYCSGQGCDPLFTEWAYRITTEGLEVWEAMSVDDTYRHLFREEVAWDVTNPGIEMRGIEQGSGDRQAHWTDQMANLREAVGRHP
jgi:hypothetical protein